MRVYLSRSRYTTCTCSNAYSLLGLPVRSLKLPIEGPNCFGSLYLARSLDVLLVMSTELRCIVDPRSVGHFASESRGQYTRNFQLD